jgi:hypothetical protein
VLEEQRPESPGLANVTENIQCPPALTRGGPLPRIAVELAHRTAEEIQTPQEGCIRLPLHWPSFARRRGLRLHEQVSARDAMTSSSSHHSSIMTV